MKPATERGARPRVPARRRFLSTIPAAFAGSFAARAARQEQPPRIGKATLDCAEKVMGVELHRCRGGSCRRWCQPEPRCVRAAARHRRSPGHRTSLQLPPVSCRAQPRPGATPGARIGVRSAAACQQAGKVEDLAFLPITSLAPLLERRIVSATELTSMYLSRLKQYGPRLNCVVTLTESLALAQAAAADKEIAAGRYKGRSTASRGARRICSPPAGSRRRGARGRSVTRCSMRMRRSSSGCARPARCSSRSSRWARSPRAIDGSEGRQGTRGIPTDPDPDRSGASGSSAGPGSATAAGLVAFGIGTETRGSIISPSAANGVTGLRPTYGRVSRHGAMALSWTMDKIGPMCRSVEDCALVFNAIYGPDGRDETVVDAPFTWPGASRSRGCASAM